MVAIKAHFSHSIVHTHSLPFPECLPLALVHSCHSFSLHVCRRSPALFFRTIVWFPHQFNNMHSEYGYKVYRSKTRWYVLCCWCPQNVNARAHASDMVHSLSSLLVRLLRSAQMNGYAKIYAFWWSKRQRQRPSERGNAREIYWNKMFGN